MMFQSTASKLLLNGKLHRSLQPLYSSSMLHRKPLTYRIVSSFSSSSEHHKSYEKTEQMSNVTKPLKSPPPEQKGSSNANNNKHDREREITSETFQTHQPKFLNLPFTSLEEAKALQDSILSNNDSPEEVPPPIISPDDFDDPKSAHGSKSVVELSRALLAFRLCNVRPLVKHAETLMSVSRRILGSTITDAVIRHTIFKHFCGGEDSEKIRPTIEALKSNGIGGIFDYAAESDISESSEAEDETPFTEKTNPPNQPARVYDYKSEKLCDKHLEVFKSCIHAVRDVSPEGFAAIKITALGNPLLLARMSTSIVEAKKLFSKFDTDGDGIINRDDFKEGYHLFFSDADQKLPQLLDRLDPNGTDSIDYIEWSKLLTPCDLPRLVENCREHGPLYLASPTPEEIDLMEAMHARAHTLAEEAFKSGVRLLIDAEHNRYQPAIDNLALELQQKYNATALTDIPIVFNTYQCYLKDMPQRMIVDVERSRCYSYHFAAKLVRGAYMTGERAMADEMGYPSPIHDTIEDTHACYDKAVKYLLRYHAQNDVNLEVMCATHNQASIQKAIELMNELGISPEDTIVHFAQLLGMSDNLTYPLGMHKYRAYKYVPYGKVNEVMPYLIRRAQENSDLFGDSSKETKLITGELKRRLFGWRS